MYYRDVDAAFVVFDVTRVSTFESAQKWKNDIDSKVCLADNSPIPAVLLANKVSIYLPPRLVFLRGIWNLPVWF
jgi:GTPase SAR1 family protein